MRKIRHVIYKGPTSLHNSRWPQIGYYADVSYLEARPCTEAQVSISMLADNEFNQSKSMSFFCNETDTSEESDKIPK